MERTLVTHTFQGARFADHGLDLEVISELVTYRTILVETAKELWRRKHAARMRLPARFTEEFKLKFYKIEEGSTAIPLVRPLSHGQLMLIDDELDEAVELVANTIACAASGKRLPDNFPSNVIPLFSEYGKTLKDDESIQQKTVRNVTAVYDARVREELMARLLDSYEDELDIVGRVVGARVTRNSKMTLMVGEDREVEASFRHTDEEKILSALVKHASAKIRVRGRANFDMNGALLKIVAVKDIEFLGADGAIAFVEDVKPIWEEISEIADQIPADVLKTLPTDGSINYHNYLHGNQSK